MSMTDFHPPPPNGIPANAEEKIKAAASELFTRNGFDAVKTRDIARAAGINLALLNYYFRSKKNLYRIIMLENFRVFFSGAFRILNQPGPGIPEKLQAVVAYYIDEISRQPHIPAFVLNEIRTNPSILNNELLAGISVMETPFYQELEAYCEAQKIPYPPVHLLLNVLGMTIFPFLAEPMIRKVFQLDNTAFDRLLQQRKSLVPHWFQLITQTEKHA